MRAALFILAGWIAFGTGAAAPALASSAPTTLVDTFVGTSGTPAGGPIDTFPGADLPFGMVQWSPDTPSQNAGGGYEYTDREITGFSLTHLSGPGCSVFGDFAILPTVGAIPNDPSVTRQPFSHSSEESAPGWYAVSLGTPAIRTELGVTARAGIGRFTFPPTAQANLLFNAASNQAGVTGATIHVDSPTEISGSASSGFFCGMPDRYTVYFVARFDRAFRQSGTWNGGRGVWLTFDATRVPRIVVKVGLSFVDVSGARANLDAQAKGWDVIAVRDRATELWNAMLRRIAISGGTSRQQRTFYTALYHVLLHPNLISDVDGRYTGFDGKIHHVKAGHAEYANYSDWDIYRTEVPLLALLAPRETSDMMQSLVDAARQENGWLPRWALVNGPTSVMGGDSVDPVIAGAYAFGARDFDARAALAAMVKGASTTTPSPAQGWYVPRWELDDTYLQHGYVVNTHTTSVSPGPNGASETLEYALDDFSIARLAFALHDAPAYAAFMRRSANWMTLFDSADHRIAPRDSDGAFMYAPITENGQSGFQEGNAAQYSWMVPQDLRDLIAALGGAPAAIAKLDEFFLQLDAGQDKPYAWLGNEPSLGTPWVYLSAGEPWRAQAIVRQALSTLYDDTPDGLPGNDDLGTMSAWYVWCAIGLYPQNPAVGYLDIGAPLFSSVTVRTPNGPVIEIAAPQSSPTNAYVEQLRLNGRTHDQSWIGLPPHGRVRLEIAVGARPNTQWASGAGAAPPSFATIPLALPPATTTVFQPTYDAVSVAAGGAKTFAFRLANGGTRPVAITWHAVYPPGLHADPDRGRIVVSDGTGETLSTRLAADGSLRAGYYAARLDGSAENGALLEHLTVRVRVTGGAQRPALAYAENRFGNTITPIDLATRATGPEIKVGEEPRDAVLSPDGTRLYVANLGGASISVVNTVERRAIATVKVGSSPSGVAIAPDGKRLWVANSDDDTIEAIDTASLKTSAPIRVGSRPRAIALAPDGSTLYVSENGSNAVAVVDLRSGKVAATIPVGERPAGLALAPDGKRLYVVNSASNDVTPVDLSDGNRILPPIPVGVYPMEIAIARDGTAAYVTNYANSTITPLDLRKDAAGLPIEVGGAPYGIAITSDGRTAIVVSHRDNSAALVDVATRRVSGPIPLGSGPYTVAAP
ncbi:MAG: GH92 family glycosyl hydrolase [Candidatus Cybelea sp.]